NFVAFDAQELGDIERDQSLVLDNKHACASRGRTLLRPRAPRRLLSRRLERIAVRAPRQRHGHLAGHAVNAIADDRLAALRAQALLDEVRPEAPPRRRAHGRSATLPPSDRERVSL